MDFKKAAQKITDSHAHWIEHREAADRLDSAIEDKLRLAHAAGRKEIEDTLNAHERSFLRVSIERDEAFEKGRQSVLDEVLPVLTKIIRDTAGFEEESKGWREDIIKITNTRARELLAKLEGEK